MRRLRIKDCLNKHSGGIWGTDPMQDANDIPCVRVADFDYQNLSLKTSIETIRNVPASQRISRVLKKGDILLEKSGGGEKTPVGRAVMFDKDFPALCSNFVERLELNSFAHPKYLTYLLNSLYLNGTVEKHIKQTTGIQNLNVTAFLSEYIDLPPLAEQLRFVKMFDESTNRIFTIINAKRQLIIKLKEIHSAIIYHAVTCGLDKDAELIESGVDWIGSIPKDWKMVKIGRSFKTIGSGSTPPSGDESCYDEGTIHWVNTGDLNDGILLNTKKQINAAGFDSSSALKMYFPGTLLVAMYGATIGKIGLLGIDACTNQACCALADSNDFETKFVYYWFLANRKNIVEMYSYGSGQPNISQNTIRSLQIPCPPKTEQQIIVRWLDERIAIIERQINSTQNSIHLLNEYRASLIESQIVT